MNSPESPNVLIALEEHLRRLAFSRPAWLHLYVRVRPKLRPLVIGRQTEIVIEGFPRSGNTFAVAAFQYAQARPVKVARHCHAPAQVLEGALRGLPVVVLKREPAAAVSSLLMRDLRLPIATALERYIWFYRLIVPVLDKVVMVDFQELVSDYGAAIARVNDQFGTRFVPYRNSDETDHGVFKLVEQMEKDDSGGALRETHVARPSEERRVLAADIRRELESPRWASLLGACRDLYESI